jgi:hypothetical protein
MVTSFVFCGSPTLSLLNPLETKIPKTMKKMEMLFKDDIFQQENIFDRLDESIN